MGIVGPFNSGVAKAEIPIVNAAGGPVLISPTNTNPGLTLSQYATANGINFAKLHPAGKPDYYFRIPGNDVAQGKADAEVALSSRRWRLHEGLRCRRQHHVWQGPRRLLHRRLHRWRRHDRRHPHVDHR